MSILLLFLMLLIISIMLIVSFSKTHTHVFIGCTAVSLCATLPLTIFMTNEANKGFLKLGTLFIAAGLCTAIATYTIAHLCHFFINRSKNKPE